MSRETRIAQALVDWFEVEAKPYPWRQNLDPWGILVSEVMLQQTTIPTVLARYSDWMARYPSPRHLAEASEEEALRSWEGLGYYRRVRNLRAAAIAIVERHDGIFPQAEKDIAALPGVGDYTLGAILSFAFNRPACLVDANVSRVFARLYNDATPIDSREGRKAQWALAAKLLHQQNPRAYNGALMELGQQICSISKPQCLICPLRRECQAVEPETLPVKLPKVSISPMSHWDILQQDSQQGILLVRQGESGRHAGMYRFPSRGEEEVAALPLITKQSYSVTRYKVTRYLYRAEKNESPREGEAYVHWSQLAAIPMASPDRKLLKKLYPEFC